MLSSILHTISSCLVVISVAKILYRVYLHPLRTVPGPTSHAASRLPYIYATLTGSLPYHLHHLHQRYGPVVRTAPKEVSFIEEEACNLIYARKDAAGNAFPKNYDSWSETSNYFTHSVFVAGQETYARIRRALHKAFSERTLLEHESTIAGNIDHFISQLKIHISHRSGDDPVARFDLGERFSWLAFDVVSQFVFGENFNCLGSSEYRPWLRDLSKTWIFIAYISSLKQIVSIATRVLNFFGMLQSRVDILAPLDSKTEELMDKEPKKPTLLSIARSQMPQSLSRIEVQANAAMFPVAGTDTTATVFSAVLYLLLRNQEALECVLDEIESIQQESDITFQRVREMPYLNAAILEAMRIYPAVPEGLPRVLPSPGQEICGHWMPPKVSLRERHPSRRSTNPSRLRCSSAPTLHTGLQRISKSQIRSSPKGGFLAPRRN